MGGDVDPVVFEILDAGSTLTLMWGVMVLVKVVMIQNIPFGEDLLRGIDQPLLVISGEELGTISSGCWRVWCLGMVGLILLILLFIYLSFDGVVLCWQLGGWVRC